jgi:O-methyltransferase
MQSGVTNPRVEAEGAGELYLDLMKKCLTYYIWGESITPLSPQLWNRWDQRFLKRALVRFLAKREISLVTNRPFNPKRRREGRDWPFHGHTMIGLKRLDNLQACIEDVIRNDVRGDLIETGVWRGGATIFMRAVLKAHGVTDRDVWAADSFEGLPLPSTDQYPDDSGDPHHTYDYLKVSLEDVKRNFETYGLLDDRVRFLKGWFKDTLPTAPIKSLAVIRLDGDMYESTMDGLSNLYQKLSVGGYVIVDDYGYWEGCRKAVQDFRTSHGIADHIEQIDWSGVYWRRSR